MPAPARSNAKFVSKKTKAAATAAPVAEDESMYTHLPDGTKFEGAFTSQSSNASVCVCVGCGKKDAAYYQYSTYPHRYMPDAWMMSSVNRGLHCRDCSKSIKAGNPPSFKFFLTNDVLLTSDGDAVFVRRPFNPPTAPEPQREKVMTNANDKKTIKDAALQEASVMGTAIALGAQMAVTDQAGEVLLNIFRKLAADVPALQPLLDTQEGREIAKFAVATALHAVASNTDVLPKREAVARLCEMQMTTASFRLINPKLALIREFAEELGGLGDKLAPVTPLKSVESKVG